MHVERKRNAMLLEQLREYSRRLSAEDALPVMYVPTPIRWYIELDTAGRLGTIASAAFGGARASLYPAPHVGRTVAVAAKLLADNAEYVLGLPRSGSDPQRVALCHAAFVALVRDCAERTGEPALKAIVRFLRALDLGRLPLPPGFDATDIVTFRVANVLPIDLLSVRKYWAAKVVRNSNPPGDAAQSEDPSAEEMACLVCGELR